MPTILVSGAANGLGAAFVKAYRQDLTNTIIALDNQSINDLGPNVRSHIVDVSSQDSVDTFATAIAQTPVDLVIHSAGVRGLVPAKVRENPGNVDACETMEAMDLATIMTTLQINSAGTFMLLRALVPGLRMAAAGKVVIMSSRMGSIGNNQSPNRAAGSAYAYRASKAAVNAIVRSLAVDVPDVTFVLCHPGRVETSLVEWKEDGAISAEESVAGLLPLIATWSITNSGQFYDRFGDRIEW